MENKGHLHDSLVTQHSLKNVRQLTWPSRSHKRILQWMRMRPPLTRSMTIHLHLLLYDVNTCKKYWIRYYRIVFDICTVVCMQECRPVLTIKVDIQYINIWFVYSWYTTCFGELYTVYMVIHSNPSLLSVYLIFSKLKYVFNVLQFYFPRSIC